MKLQTKFFISSASVAIIALLVLSLFSYHRYAQVTYQRIDDMSENMFQNAEEESNKTLDEIRQIITSFNFYYSDGTSTAQLFQNYNDPENVPSSYQFNQDSRSFDRFCQSILFQNSNIYGIYIITSSGYIFSQSTGRNGTTNRSYKYNDSEWYRKTLELNGQYYISPAGVHELFTGGSTSIFFSQYLKDVYTGKESGILVIDCDPKMFDLRSVNTMPDVIQLSLQNTETGDFLYQSSEDIFNGKKYMSGLSPSI